MKREVLKAVNKEIGALIDKFKKNIYDLESEKASMQKEIEDLKSEETNLQSRIIDYKSEIDRLKEVRDGIMISNELLTKDNFEKEAEIESLKGKLNAIAIACDNQNPDHEIFWKIAIS